MYGFLKVGYDSKIKFFLSELDKIEKKIKKIELDEVSKPAIQKK